MDESRPPRVPVPLAAASILAVSLYLSGLPGCASRGSGKVLRLATTQPGERMRGPFRAALDGFELRHPGVRVDVVEMSDTVYQQMGLVTLFVGGTPPDVYFQWGGHLVRKYAAAGYALDLTPDLPAAERSRYLPTCWSSCAGDDGKIYLWPDTASLTTTFWYSRSAFREMGLREPESWDELLRLCDRLKSGGTIPFAVGNRELWPGGNLGAYFVAQYAGVAHYNRVLGLAPGTGLDDPLFVRALDFVADLHARGYMNQGVGGVGTEDARSLHAQGRAAFHPIGDWMVTQSEEKDAEDLDAFRLPRLPGQCGDDTTLLALATGYMIHRRTRYPEEARALLRHLTSDAVQREWSRHGHLSALRSAAPGPDAPQGLRRLMRFLREARETALAPDVGFNLEVSDAFLDAVSLVLAGRESPRNALAAAERQVRSLRRPSGD